MCAYFKGFLWLHNYIVIRKVKYAGFIVGCKDFNNCMYINIYIYPLHNSFILFFSYIFTDLRYVKYYYIFNIGVNYIIKMINNTVSKEK